MSNDLMLQVSHLKMRKLRFAEQVESFECGKVAGFVLCFPQYHDWD